VYFFAIIFTLFIICTGIVRNRILLYWYFYSEDV